MIDSLQCQVCKHRYVFISDDGFGSKLAHYAWACEVLAEVDKCVSAELARAMVALSIKWSDLSKEVYK